jgi:hypothetical protein
MLQSCRTKGLGAAQASQLHTGRRKLTVVIFCDEVACDYRQSNRRSIKNCFGFHGGIVLVLVLRAFILAMHCTWFTNGTAGISPRTAMVNLPLVRMGSQHVLRMCTSFSAVTLEARLEKNRFTLIMYGTLCVSGVFLACRASFVGMFPITRGGDGLLLAFCYLDKSHFELEVCL